MLVVVGKDGHGLAVERDVLNLVHDEVSFAIYSKLPETGGREVRKP